MLPLDYPIPQNCADSQSNARTILIIKASGDRIKKGGGASLGKIPIDAERLFLKQVEHTGTASVRGLFMYVYNLWGLNSPYRDEIHLNRFLIKLGKALSSKKLRGKQPPLDWEGRVTELEKFLVDRWCEVSNVAGFRWPELCRFTMPCLMRSLAMCKPQMAKTDTQQSFTKRIQRLGLISVPANHRIKDFYKEGDRFIFK